MQKTQLIKAISALSVALFVGGAVTTVDASAKAVKTTGARVTKITKNTHYKKTAFKKAHPKQGVTLYSSRYLTKHVTSKNTKTFYSTESVRVKKSTGKTATYRYVKNVKGSVKGWIWAGNLKGKQGKVTKVSNKTVIAPTTNTKIASKTTYTKIKGSNTQDSFNLTSDAVSNTNYRGMKNVGKLRDALNKLATILAKHPHAWDKNIGYEYAFDSYSAAGQLYGQMKSGDVNGSGYNSIIKERIKSVNKTISKAEC
ncbi:hypothetical protein ACFQ44_03655 [Levilactobacillus lanxiensis]|uniref:D-alanyl-D-alanine carboxypeptidase n=1 Tax=Levilactobacillus lanxiensis TaxID=2799568 RepID=A0ABW4D237_9LACO|nr:hypothetical protein [Levilactobacillus lanxiensis]